MTTTAGANAYTFAAPFAWNGTSSLYVDICFQNTVDVGYDDILTRNGAGIATIGTNITNPCSATAVQFYASQLPVLTFTRSPPPCTLCRRLAALAPGGLPAPLPAAHPASTFEARLAPAQPGFLLP